MERTNLVDVDGLIKHFPVNKGIIFSKQVGSVRAIDNVSFSIGQGETFSVAGESGCGKTTLAKVLLLLESITGGKARFRGQEISGLRGRELKQYRRSVQAVFQDPYSSLSPRMLVKDIISEPLRVHLSLSKRETRERVAELLEVVGLRPEGANLYPHEFSGGQRQRIAVARALALNPEFVILDEPVSALDVSIRAQVLNLLQDVQERFGLTYLLIAHDLAVVRHMSNKVAVMYLGKIAEMGDGEEVYKKPLHPYTVALLTAVPRPDPEAPDVQVVLSGEVPSALNPPLGCRFHPRCPIVSPECSQEEPQLREVAPGHKVACHRV